MLPSMDFESTETMLPSMDFESRKLNNNIYSAPIYNNSNFIKVPERNKTLGGNLKFKNNNIYTILGLVLLACYLDYQKR